MDIASFKEFRVWQKAIELAKEIYGIIAHLSKVEMVGLVSKICHSVISIPSNIAEVRKRGTRKDFVQCLRIASSSATELETQLVLLRKWYAGILIHQTFRTLGELQRLLVVMAKRIATISGEPESYKLKPES